MLPSRKGPRKAGGVQSVWVPSAGILCGCPSATKSKLVQARFFLLNSFGNEVVEFVTFRDCFCRVGTPLDERIRKRLGGLQHQLQLGFAVVARLVFATAMTGDRIVGLFLDLGITPLRLDIIAERVVRFVAQLRRRVLDAEPAHPLADIAAGGVATAVILTADRRSPVLIWRADRRQPCGLPR